MTLFVPRVSSFDLIKFLGFKYLENNIVDSNNIKKVSRYYFNRATYALEFLLQSFQRSKPESKIKIALPYYYCGETVEYLSRTYEIVFYNLNNKTLLPDLDELKTYNFDILLINFYFGSPLDTKPYFDLCQEKNNYLVVDMAHCHPITQIPRLTHFSIQCYHKFFPCLEGGCLSLNVKEIRNEALKSNLVECYEKLTQSSALFFLTKIVLSYLKYLFEIFFSWHRPRKKQEDSMVFTPLDDKPRRINKLALNYLRTISHEILQTEYTKREQIALEFSYFLSCFDLSTRALPLSGNYALVLRFSPQERQQITQILDNNFVPYSTWPSLTKEGWENGESKNLFESTLILPIFTTKKLSKIAKKLTADIDDLSKQEKFYAEEVLDKSSYTEMLNLFPRSNMLQSWEYGEAKKVEGWTAKRCAVKNSEGQVLCIYQLLTKKKFGLKIERINRAPVASSLYTELVGLRNLKKMKLLPKSLLIIHPNLNSSMLFSHSIKSMNFFSLGKTHRTSYLDLHLPEEDLLKALDSKWRNCLTNSFTLDFQVKILEQTASIFDDYMNEYDLFKRHKNFSGIPRHTLEALFNENPQKFIFLCAIQDEKSIGKVIIYLHGNSATYLIGMTDDIGRKSRANYRLLWQAIIELKERAIKSLDLGGIGGVELEGINSFKLGINGDILETNGEYLTLN